MDVATSPHPNVGSPLTQAVKLHLGRAMRCDFTRDHATDAERAALARAAPPVTAPAAQDYLAWRRSMAWVALPAVGLAFGIQLVEWLSNLGEESLTGTFHFLALVLLASEGFLLGALLSLVRGWTDGPRSRRLLRVAWITRFVTPLLVSLVPALPLVMGGQVPDASVPEVGPVFARLQQGIATGEDQQALGVWAQSMVLQVAQLLVGLAILIELAPVFLAIFPGLTRAGLAVKTLLPGRPVGGAIAGVTAPIYAAGFLVAGAVLQQIGGSFVLGLGLLVFLWGPLVHARRAGVLVRPMSPEEAGTAVRAARRSAGVFVGVGALLMFVGCLQIEVMGFRLIGFGDKALLGPFTLLQKLVTYVGTLTVFTVVATDWLSQGLLRLERVTPFLRSNEHWRRDGERLEDVGRALEAPPEPRPPSAPDAVPPVPPA